MMRRLYILKTCFKLKTAWFWFDNCTISVHSFGLQLRKIFFLQLIACDLAKKPASIYIYGIFIHGINYLKHISLSMATIFWIFFASKTIISAVFHKIRVRIIAQKVPAHIQFFSPPLCGTWKKAHYTLWKLYYYLPDVILLFFLWSLPFSAVCLLRKFFI